MWGHGIYKQINIFLYVYLSLFKTGVFASNKKYFANFHDYQKIYIQKCFSNIWWKFIKKTLWFLNFFFSTTTGRFFTMRNVLQGKHRQYDDGLSWFILNNKTRKLFNKTFNKKSTFFFALLFLVSMLMLWSHGKFRDWMFLV